MSRAKRSTWNFLSVLISTAVTLVIGVVSTRLLVSWLGKERLGAFQAVSDWGGYLGLLEASLGGALTPMIARAINRAVPGEVADAMASGFYGYRIIAVFNLLGGAVLVLAIPWLVTVSPELTHDLRVAAFLTAISALLLPLSPLRNLWEADQRGYIVTSILLLQSLVITGTSLLCARLGFGIAGQALAVLLGLLVYLGVLLFSTVRRHPEVYRWFLSPAPAEGKAQLWALNWPTLGLAVSGRLSLLTDRIVIAHFLGSASVIPFFITQRLALIAQGQLQAVGNSTWAGMVHLREVEGPDAFNNRLQELSQLIMVLGLSVIVPIIAYNGAFIALWMPGQGLYAGMILTVLAGANALLQAMFSFWAWMFSGTGRVRDILPLNVVSTALNVTASVGLTVLLRSIYPRYSLLGPVAGTSIAFFTCNLWWWPFLLRRCFGTSVRGLWAASAKPLVVAVPLVLLTFAVARVFPPRHWILLGLEMGTVAIASLLANWALVLSPPQKQVWTERLMRALQLLKRQPDDVASS